MGDELALRAVIGIIGLAVLAGGLALVFLPAAPIATGVLLLAVAALPGPRVGKT